MTIEKRYRTLKSVFHACNKKHLSLYHTWKLNLLLNQNYISSNSCIIWVIKLHAHTLTTMKIKLYLHDVLKHLKMTDHRVSHYHQHIQQLEARRIFIYIHTCNICRCMLVNSDQNSYKIQLSFLLVVDHRWIFWQNKKSWFKLLKIYS